MINKIKNEELSLKDLYNYGFEIFIKNFKYILVLALIIFIPMNALFLIVPEGMFLTAEDMLNINGIDPAKLYYTAAVYLAMICFFMPLLYGGLTGLVHDVVSGKSITLTNVFSGSIEKTGKHILTSVLYFFLISVTAIVIFPAIYFAIVYRFYAHAVAATGKWGFGAFSISAVIVKGRWLKTLGFIMLTVLFSVMISNLFGMVLSLVFGSFLVGSLGNIIFTVLLSIADVYFEVVIALFFINRLCLFQKKANALKMNP